MFPEHSELFLVVTLDCEECKEGEMLLGLYTQKERAEEAAKECAKKYGTTFVYTVLTIGETIYHA